MKPILLTCSLLLFELGIICGQTSRFCIGFEAGASKNFRSTGFIPRNDLVTAGFYSAVAFQYNFKSVFSVRTNAAFATDAIKSTVQTTDDKGQPIGTATSQTHWQYLTVPLLLRATFGKKLQYFFNCGPYMEFLIKQAGWVEASNLPLVKYDNTSLLNRLDAGVALGVGICIPVQANLSLTLEARDNFGLCNVGAIASPFTFRKNSAYFLLGLNYCFGARN